MDKGLHIAGVSVAVALHVAMGVGLLFTESRCQAEASERNLDDRRYVEAALAIKGQQEQESRQPQKPREQRRASDPDPQPSPEPQPEPQPEPDPTPSRDPEPQPPSDDFDPMEVLERNRRLAEDDTVDQEGVEREEVGALAGSEWGTQLDAQGDPYVGELAGRIKKAWEFPSLERTEELEAWGCVKLDEAGAIVEREVAVTSDSATLNRSVDVALDNATDMEEPVPDHLRELLLEQGICFAFRP